MVAAAELANGAIGNIGINDKAEIPLDRGQAGDRNEAGDLALTVDFGLRNRRGNRRRIDLEEIGQRLVDEFRIGVNKDLAVLADEERISVRAGIHRLDHVDQRIEREVAARHAGQLAIDGDGNGGGDDEPARRGVVIGFG